MFINRYLAAFARGHGGKITVTCFLQLILTLLGTMISLGVAFVVRMLQGEARILFFSELWQVFAAIGICIALRYALSRKKMLAAEQCSLGIKASLRDGLLRKLFALGPAYTGRERTGNIASTISSKVEYLNEYYTIYLPAAISAVVNAVLIVSTLFLFNRPSAWTCLTGCLGMLGCPMLFYFLMRKRGEAEMQAHAQYYSDCLDSVQGMSTLKAFNAVKDYLDEKLHEECGVFGVYSQRQEDVASLAYYGLYSLQHRGQ